MFLVWLLSSACTADQMNPVNYTVANPAPGFSSVRGFVSPQYFEVLTAPISNRYSEVFWKNLPSIPLPSDVVTKYNNSVIAFTGYEVDVVRKDSTGKLESVPAYDSYNHHYIVQIVGSMDLAPPEPQHAHNPFHFVHPNQNVYPEVQDFSEHNGNEHRQSYHGWPARFTQNVFSPKSLFMQAMQINTKNPDGSGKRGGPLPRSSCAPPNASYSGLIECPCTTRITKVLRQTLSQFSSCATAFPDAESCFSGAAALLSESSRGKNITTSSDSLPSGCSVMQQSKSNGPEFDIYFNTASGGSCKRTQSALFGNSTSLVQLSVFLDTQSQMAAIQMSGPTGVWFGVGFGAQAMADAPYAIIVDGAGNVTERQLGNHDPGIALPPFAKVISVSVQGGNTTVLLSRPFSSTDSRYYSFNVSASTLPFINAIGSTPQFSQHKFRAAASLALFQTDAPTCVCQGQVGTIAGVPYDPHCTGALAAEHNPTCDVSTYVGGLACCFDGIPLLDADQEVPAEVSEVMFKWRFYYEDFKPDYHIRVFRLDWDVNDCDGYPPRGSPYGCIHVEYDVPKAPSDTPLAQRVHTVVSNFTFGQLFMPGCDAITDPLCADTRLVEPQGVALIMVGGHCHAAECISLELWNRDTQTLLCTQSAVMGSGDRAQDEDGYVWVPPCQFSPFDPSLPPPPILHLNSNLTIIKRANSTYYHPGVMALWQMRGAYRSDWA